MASQRRRKSLKKQVVKITAEGEKTRVHFTLTPKGKTETTVEDYSEKREDRVCFGRVEMFRNELTGVGYRENKGEYALIFLNGESIMIDKHTYRKILSITAKMGHFLGVLGKKKVVKRGFRKR